MEHLVSRLLLYGEQDGLLSRLAGICRSLSGEQPDRAALTRQYLDGARELLDLAARWRVSGDLWQQYLTYLLLTAENPFTLTAERAPAPVGTLAALAMADLGRFRALFHYDFSGIEKALGVEVMDLLRHYDAGNARPGPVGLRLEDTRKKLAEAEDDKGFYAVLTQAYTTYGAGQPGLYPAFWAESCREGLRLRPAEKPDRRLLRDLVGCQEQSRQLRENTEAFLAGRGGNNALLYGDAGTGKSTSVKALVNEYYPQGLRLVELYKHQLNDLPGVLARLKDRRYRFILLLDDLSFEENEGEYKALKAIIEGGVETRPENVRVYATSNRRNLIRETWRDRSDMEHSGDVHRSDTVEETLSLSARFGLRIYYPAPNQENYRAMVLALAQRQGLEMPQGELLAQADRWSRRRGSRSGRTAQQLVDTLVGAGEKEREKERE